MLCQPLQTSEALAQTRALLEGLSQKKRGPGDSKRQESMDSWPTLGISHLPHVGFLWARSGITENSPGGADGSEW